MKQLDWDNFKGFLINQELTCSWVKLNQGYWLKASFESFECECIIFSEPEVLEFESTYKQ